MYVTIIDAAADAAAATGDYKSSEKNFNETKFYIIIFVIILMQLQQMHL